MDVGFTIPGTIDLATGAADNEPEEAALTFHEQADGRKVARLPGGKVVLLDINQLARVAAGERWIVKLRHRESFAIAEPVDLAREPLLPNPVLPAGFRAPKLRPAPVPPAAAAPAGRQPTLDSPPPAPAQPVAATAPAERRTLPSEIIRPSDRVAMFVDGANMDGACRAAGYFVDYRKAREFFLAGGRFYAGFYYIADFTASDPLQQRYLDFLSHSGYIVRPAPGEGHPRSGRRRADHQGQPRHRDRARHVEYGGQLRRGVSVFG